jgi:inner membrane protein
MASIGHLAVGAALGAIYSRTSGSNPRTAIPVFALLALAPDLDLVTAAFGALPDTPTSHRGITHSLPFAAIVALAVGLCARRWGRGRLAGALTLGALGSHGILDAMSQLGDGPMMFWPFTTQTYVLAWRPIPGVLSASYYLTLEAIPTLLAETFLFLPFIVFALLTLLPRSVEKPAAQDALG